MSKERLEEIKANAEDISYMAYGDGGRDSFKVEKVELAKHDYDWLIEQAEKAEELEKENERYEKSINDALKELHLSNACGNESVKEACNILKGESK